MLNHLSAADLRSLRVFASIADSGGLAACEERLNVSSSTISTQLSTLEKRLGYRLCNRGRGGFSLTTRGKTVLDEYERLTGAIEGFCNRVNELSDSVVGNLRLGLLDHTLTESAFPITDITRRFLELAPDARIEIVHDVQTNLKRAIIEDRLDLSIGVFDTRSKLITSSKMHTETQSVYCGRHHPFFGMKRGAISRRKLEHVNWVSRGYSLGPHVRFPIAPMYSTATAANIEAVFMLIRAGHHVGYLPEHFAMPFEDNGDLRKIELANTSLQLDFYLIARSGREENVVMRTFRRAIAEIGSEHSA